MVDCRVVCTPADPDSVDARALIAELDAALAAITGDSGASSFDAADVRGPGAVFLVARAADGTAVGCGALRPLAPGLAEPVAELKRMYARPGSGAGRALLAALEQQARAMGYRAIHLSTRRVNARAVDFYRRHGYADVAPWGKYVGSGRSVCLGRELIQIDLGDDAGQEHEQAQEAGLGHALWRHRALARLPDMQAFAQQQRGVGGGAEAGQRMAERHVADAEGEVEQAAQAEHGGDGEIEGGRRRAGWTLLHDVIR
jgi:GNAT superfamily N-acetyltransferase